MTLDFTFSLCDFAWTEGYLSDVILYYYYLWTTLNHCNLYNITNIYIFIIEDHIDPRLRFMASMTFLGEVCYIIVDQVKINRLESHMLPKYSLSDSDFALKEIYLIMILPTNFQIFL